HIAAIWHLLVMNRQPVDKRGVGRRNDRLCGNAVAVRTRGDCALGVFFEGNNRRSGIGLTAIAFDGPAQPGKVTARMEARLIGKTQAAKISARDRRICPCDANEAQAHDGLVFLFQNFVTVSVRRKAKEVDTGEIAIDTFVGANLFDAIEGGPLTFEIKLSLVLAPHLDEFEVKIVDLIAQMGAGAGGHTAGYGTAIDYDNLAAGTCQFIRNGQPGYSATNHKEFRLQIGCKGARLWKFRLHPERSTAFTVDVHRSPPTLSN